MAEKIVRTLVDDIDGTAATHTRRFSVDGKNYRIDLSDKNNERFEKALELFVGKATVESGSATRGRSAGKKLARDFDPAAVRAWAATKKIELSSRGRIPQHIVERYRAEA